MDNDDKNSNSKFLASGKPIDTSESTGSGNLEKIESEVKTLYSGQEKIRLDPARRAKLEELWTETPWYERFKFPLYTFAAATLGILLYVQQNPQSLFPSTDDSETLVHPIAERSEIAQAFADLPLAENLRLKYRSDFGSSDEVASVGENYQQIGTHKNEEPGVQEKSGSTSAIEAAKTKNRETPYTLSLADNSLRQAGAGKGSVTDPIPSFKIGRKTNKSVLPLDTSGNSDDRESVPSEMKVSTKARIDFDRKLSGVSLAEVSTVVKGGGSAARGFINGAGPKKEIFGRARSVKDRLQQKPKSIALASQPSGPQPPAASPVLSSPAKLESKKKAKKKVKKKVKKQNRRQRLGGGSTEVASDKKAVGGRSGRLNSPVESRKSAQRNDTFQFSNISVSGGLTQNVVLEFLLSKRQDLSLCKSFVRRGTEVNADIWFVVAANSGKFSSARSAGENKKFTSCIQNQLKKWIFHPVASKAGKGKFRLKVKN